MNASLLLRVLLGPPAALPGILGNPERQGVLRDLRLLPYLWRRLDRAGLTGKLPGPLARAWRASAQANLARNLWYLDLLEDVSLTLDRQGLAWAPLKGLALMVGGVYHPMERPVSDLDLLVRSAEFPAVVACLQRAGFQPTGPFRRGDHCLPLARDGCNLGLHRELLPSRRYGFGQTDEAENGLLLTHGRPDSAEAAAALLFSLAGHFVYSHACCGALQLLDLLRTGPQLAARADPLVFQRLMETAGMARGCTALLRILDDWRPGGLGRLCRPDDDDWFARVLVTLALQRGLSRPDNRWHWWLPALLAPGRLPPLSLLRRFPSQVWKMTRLSLTLKTEQG